MQTVSMEPAEELPSMLWGLDPVFGAFARLFVTDILQMTESIQVPGIYFYNCHPIYKVDVLGTVVYKKEREDFYCYGVDDGTGVINCLCWKREALKETMDSKKTGLKSGVGSLTFDPVSELQKVHQTLQNLSRLDIGELIRVRGPVKTSRQQREIMASSFYKVDDPLMSVQISWMTEVLQLYRVCYDKPPQLPSNTTGDSPSPLNKATRILKDFLKQKSVSRFRPYDVQDLLQPLIFRPPPTDQEAGPSGCQQLRLLLKDVLQILQDEGVVFRKVLSQDELYHVTERDTDLIITVKDIIREDSKRDKFADKGCHVLHILSAVRLRYSPNVSKGALELLLQSLECNSDIISTANNYYTIL